MPAVVAIKLLNGSKTMQYNIFGGLASCESTRMQVKAGCDYIRSGGGIPILRTRHGAQFIANRMAKESGLPGAVGTVADCGNYFRVNVGSMPFNL